MCTCDLTTMRSVLRNRQHSKHEHVCMPELKSRQQPQSSKQNCRSALFENKILKSAHHLGIAAAYKRTDEYEVRRQLHVKATNAHTPRIPHETANDHQKHLQNFVQTSITPSRAHTTTLPAIARRPCAQHVCIHMWLEMFHKWCLFSCARQ